MSDNAPDHIESTVQQMADLHGEHAATATPLQRAFQTAAARLARPGTLLALLALILVWIGYNAYASRHGFWAPDPPPFGYLELVVSIAAFSVTILILATQRRDDVGARHRAQLTLNMTTLTEQKVAKVIRLLEEQRRDSPTLSDRPDEEALAMAAPTDPKHVLERIKVTHEGEEPG